MPCFSNNRNFPPEIGGMQNLMGGLTTALVDHGPVKYLQTNLKDLMNLIRIQKLKLKDLGVLNSLENTEKQIGSQNLLKKITI